MLHTIQVMTVATFDQMLGVLSMAEEYTIQVPSFDRILGVPSMDEERHAAHLSGHDSGHI